MSLSDDTRARPEPDPDSTREQTPLQAASSAASSGGAAPPPIPGYEIVEEIGHGGMGVVYLATQLGFDRRVAIKTVLRAGLPPALMSRFWAEAEVLAELNHPHVVQVFEFGLDSGRPYMTMEYVSGGSLAQRLLDGPLPAPAAAALVERIARGVAAAHGLGIVHRDLKPANVLMAAPDRPKVADFGIAKWRDADLTHTRAVMGTPSYMAPEQAKGESKFVGPPADVWALGVILYECLAGAKPFAGATAEALLLQVQTAEPAPLRRAAPSVPLDLETIVLKCLTREPELRYATAGELADDLARFGRGEPIAARRAGPVTRLVRSVRRKPSAATAGLFALALLLPLAGFAVVRSWLAARAARAELAAATAQEKPPAPTPSTAPEELARARELLARWQYAGAVQHAYRLWESSRIGEARAVLDATPPDLRGWEYGYVYHLCLPARPTPAGAGALAPDSARSPDGTRTLDPDGIVVRVRDAATGAAVTELRGHRGTVRAAVWSPTGSRIATAGDDDTLRVWDAATGAELLALPGRDSAAFTADGRHLSTRDPRGAAALIYDSAPGHRAVLRVPVAPPPRPVGNR